MKIIIDEYEFGEIVFNAIEKYQREYNENLDTNKIYNFAKILIEKTGIKID